LSIHFARGLSCPASRNGSHGNAAHRRRQVASRLPCWRGAAETPLPKFRPIHSDVSVVCGDGRSLLRKLLNEHSDRFITGWRRSPPRRGFRLTPAADIGPLRVAGGSWTGGSPAPRSPHAHPPSSPVRGDRPRWRRGSSDGDRPVRVAPAAGMSRRFWRLERRTGRALEERGRTMKFLAGLVAGAVS